MPTTKKTEVKKAAVKASTSKKLISKNPFKKIFKSQQGILKVQSLSKSQFAITAAVLSSIGIMGVMASHAGSSGQLRSSAYYGCTSSASLAIGSRGNCVVYLQNQLNYYHKVDSLVFNNVTTRQGTVMKNADLVPDGVFGSNTDVAVRAFQRFKGQKKPDGVVGSQTWQWIGMPSAAVIKTPGVCPAGSHKVSSGDCQQNFNPAPTKPTAAAKPAITAHGLGWSKNSQGKPCYKVAYQITGPAQASSYDVMVISQGRLQFGYHNAGNPTCTAEYTVNWDEPSLETYKSAIAPGDIIEIDSWVKKADNRGTQYVEAGPSAKVTVQPK